MTVDQTISLIEKLHIEKNDLIVVTVDQMPRDSTIQRMYDGLKPLIDIGAHIVVVTKDTNVRKLSESEKNELRRQLGN